MKASVETGASEDSGSLQDQLSELVGKELTDAVVIPTYLFGQKMAEADKLKPQMVATIKLQFDCGHVLLSAVHVHDGGPDGRSGIPRKGSWFRRLDDQSTQLILEFSDQTFLHVDLTEHAVDAFFEPVILDVA